MKYNWRCAFLTNESTIRLLRSKLRVYKTGYWKAAEKGDKAEAKKWKDGYMSTRERIIRLKES